MDETELDTEREAEIDLDSAIDDAEATTLVSKSGYTYQMVLPNKTLSHALSNAVDRQGSPTAAIKRAEEALTALSDEFEEWMDGDIDALMAAAGTYADDPSVENRAALFKGSHNIKGNGSTLGQPLLTGVCDAFCYLLENFPEDRAIPQTVLVTFTSSIQLLHRAHKDGDQAASASRCDPSELVSSLRALAQHQIDQTD